MIYIFSMYADAATLILFRDALRLFKQMLSILFDYNR